MIQFNIKIGQEAKRLRVIRDSKRIDEELTKYKNRKEEKQLFVQRETEEQKRKLQEKLKEEELRKIEDEERSERLKELERKEAIITRYWKNFTIANEGKLLDLDLSKVVEDSLPVSVVKEEIQTAYERGMEDGQMQAMTTYKIEIEKYQEWIRRIDSIGQELSQEHVLAIHNFEKNLIDLASMIAETIIDEKIQEDKSIVIKQVRKAISLVHNEKIFKIHVNPELTKILEEVKSTLLVDSIEANKIEIYPNPSVAIGGCLLETSGGLLDARIKNQLKKIYKELNIEDERVFSSKEIHEEMSDFYEEADKNKKVNLKDDEIPAEISYDDLPEEYKEMFGDDIFGNEEFDENGNIIDNSLIEELPEEIEKEIDYQALYEEELRKQEEEEIDLLKEQESGTQASEEESESNNQFDIDDFDFEDDFDDRK